jgi:chloride channel protein, CIC family
MSDRAASAPERIRAPLGSARRVHAWLHGTSAGLMSLGVVVGIGAGAGAVVFRELIIEVTRLFTGFSDYSAAGRAANPHLPGLGMWFVALAPVVGGLVYGPLISRFASEARGHGVPEVMFAVAENGGRIRPRVAAVKALASAICIGSGGSVGREGPIVQIGSALGSTIGQALRIPESRLRLLVACGAAGGISATFNAPIAGVFFALELILRDFEVDSFGVVVLASVVADVIGRAAFGAQPFLLLPAFQQKSPWEYALYAGLGLTAAIVGTVFVRVLYGLEDIADRMWRGPQWLRPAAGGILLGGLLLALPQLYGVGYPVLEHAVGGGYTTWFLVGLLAGKLAATSLTIAIGGSGGVFAPSLFMGAMFGTAYGDLAGRIDPHLVGQAGAYGLVGMGAVFAGAARAPITAVVIIFELTGDYHIILPLMVSIVIATAVASMLGRDSIYTLKLRRRGIDVHRARPTIMHRLTVADAMRPLPAPVADRDPLPVLIERLAATSEDALPVVARDGAYLGVITSTEVDRAAGDNHLDAVAADLAVAAPTLHPAQSLATALDLVLRPDIPGVPVVTADGRPLGWINHRDVLRAYNERLRAEHPETATHREHPPPARQKPRPPRRAELAR